MVTNYAVNTLAVGDKVTHDLFPGEVGTVVQDINSGYLTVEFFGGARKVQSWAAAFEKVVQPAPILWVSPFYAPKPCSHAVGSNCPHFS